MKFKVGIIVAAVAVLAGCSTTKEYQMYAEAQRAKVQADAIVEAAKWNALAEVAKSGDVTAKVAVAMAVQASNGGGKAPNAGMAAPKSSADTALQWSSLLLPNLVQFYSINRNSAVAMRQSDNATALGVAQSNNQANVSMNTNAAFSNIAGAGLTAATTISGQGITGITSVVTNTNAALQALQPNVTTTTTNNLTCPVGQTLTAGSCQ